MADVSEGISATGVRRLTGGSFEIKDLSSNRNIRFTIGDQGQVVAAGAEAYGLPVDGKRGWGQDLAGFLKVFRHQVPERNQRNLFLVVQGLASRHWLFQGVPFGFLPQMQINGIEVHGNLSFRIRDRRGGIAPSLAQLVTTDQWVYDTETRSLFCGQLCCAIYALEELGWVHGDLSLGNVLIGWQEGQGEVAVLVDFDGFYHPRQPLLPLKVGRHDMRRVGSEGFQDPNLLDEIARDPSNACVRCDRFALGALICQLIVWQPWMAGQLSRHHLLSGDMIRKRNLEGLPGKIQDIWPQGFDLLQKALAGRRPHDQPGPREWLAAVGGPPIRSPTLLVSNGRLRPAVYLAVELRSSAGSLGALHPELAPVKFTRQGEDVLLEFGWTAQVIVPLRDEAAFVPGAPVALKAGSKVTSNFWKFELQTR